MHFAAVHGHREIVSLLLKAHAYVNALDVRCAAALRFYQNHPSLIPSALVKHLWTFVRIATPK